MGQREVQARWQYVAGLWELEYTSFEIPGKKNDMLCDNLPNREMVHDLNWRVVGLFAEGASPALRLDLMHHP